MIKKIIIALLTIIPILGFFPKSYAEAPSVNCFGLPGCEDTNITNPSPAVVERMNTLEWISKIVGELIKYVSVAAVISVMISGVMYMTSGGEEEKTKKAKNWIIWSLVGVFLSISAWGIINILNAINIGNTTL